MKTLLIIGGTGFIGNCFIDFFKKNNCENFSISKVILAGRNLSKIKYKKRLKTKNIFFKKIDLESKKIDFPQADYVIHAAENYSNVIEKNNYNYKESYKFTKKISYHYNNTNYLSKLIFISSGAVYGKNMKYKKITERNTVSLKKILKYKNFKVDYAKSKIKSETYLKKNFKSNFIIVRLFSVISSNVPKNKNFVIGNFLDDIKKKGEIKIKTLYPKKIFRSFIFYEDLVKIFIKLLNFDNKKGEVFNVGSSEGVSIYELSKIMSKYFEKKIFLQDKLNKSKISELDYYVPNIEKLKIKLKIKNLTNIRKSISKL
tara:strand:+ start:675 stop:1619 length:945 start_codon:yes stop_codon:yes gene_type:complete